MGKFFDPTRATYSSYTPGAEANDTMSMLKKNPKKAEALKEVFEGADKLIDMYKNILTAENFTKANMFRWGRTSIEEFSRLFLVCVVMNYKVWEISQIEFESLRMAVKQNNPEWYERFMNDAKEKINRSVRKSNIVLLDVA